MVLTRAFCSARPEAKMTGPQLEFIAFVEACDVQWMRPDWMPDIMKVVHLVPIQMSPQRAAAAFLRWLHDEPPHDGDGAMRMILEGS